MAKKSDPNCRELVFRFQHEDGEDEAAGQKAFGLEWSAERVVDELRIAATMHYHTSLESRHAPLFLLDLSIMGGVYLSLT
jgi:hypothetical protein